MVVNVLVELSNKNIDKTFDYLVPKELEDKIGIGKRVTVPFQHLTLEGFILDTKSNYDGDLKNIISVNDEDIILNSELLELGKEISKKTLSTLISAYQTMLPKALKASINTNINKKLIKYIELNNVDLSNIKKDTQLEIINYLKEHGKSKINDLSNYSSSSINTLIKNKIIKLTYEEEYRLNKENTNTKKIKLNEEQENVVKTIINDKESNTYLIHGVTGSGKTEVYMEIIDDNIKHHKSSIVLVPEISLTPQIVERFYNRFGSRIAILHSRLSDGERYDEYRKITRGEVDIVIGARSAVFAPLKNIGSIIIDEEHSTTYKQENNPKYNTIDVAILRSKYHKAKVILGSATPSLESYSKAIKGVYKLLELKKRANGNNMPNVTIVDMNKDKNKGSYFSKLLHDKIEEELSDQL